MPLEDVAAAAPDAERWFQLYVVGGMALQPRRSWSAPRRPATGRSSSRSTCPCSAGASATTDPASSCRRCRTSIRPANEREQPVRRHRRPVDRRPDLGDARRDPRRGRSMPLVVKGILAPGRRARAPSRPASPAIVVSTHGGRQLDRSISTADALPAIVEAVGGRCEVWVDGGIRRGLDVVTALALGATGRARRAAVLLGARRRRPRRRRARRRAPPRTSWQLALPLLGCASIAEVEPGAARLARPASRSQSARAAGTGRAGGADGPPGSLGWSKSSAGSRVMPSRSMTAPRALVRRAR